MSLQLEERKRAEIEWADRRRSIDPANAKEARRYLANRKYYSVVRTTTDYVQHWLRENCRDRDVFEMACGNGGYSRWYSDVARSCLAADIAPKSIEQAIERAQDHPAWRRIRYCVLDCENTGLPPNSFDIICEGGALHHMHLPAVCREVVRLLRPGGQFFCVEALRHNPLIHAYRRLTPHLRTAWEVDHILGRREILGFKRYFEQVEIRLFHVTTLFAVPFRKTHLFPRLLSVLEHIDRVATRVPLLRWLSWQAVFVARGPRKMLEQDAH